MGIYDREYIRHEGPGFLRSLADRGQVCKWLILVNVACFLIQVFDRHGEFTRTFVLDTEAVRQGQIWRLLTYAFLHDPDRLLHIVFNMLFLWWFGKDVEDLYGPREFLAFYLVSAVLGGLAFTGWTASQGDGYCLGASGAVTAVLILFALHFPTVQIYLWFLIPVPIWLFVIFQVGQDVYVFLSGIRSPVAVSVHLGGAAFGFLYYKFHWRLLGFWPRWRTWLRERTRPRLRVYHEESGSRSAPVVPPLSGDFDEHLEAKVDAVLEKVARSGRESLTDAERQILVRASEVYKKRRT